MYEQSDADPVVLNPRAGQWGSQLIEPWKPWKVNDNMIVPQAISFADVEKSRAGIYLQDDPRIEAMEAAFLLQREQHLEERLASLEVLAESINAAGDRPDEDGVHAWQSGGRDFDQVFIRDSLGGFYIDKAKVAKREAFLMAVAHQSCDHSFIDFIAGRSHQRHVARTRLLEQRAWRDLDQFDEVPSDCGPRR